MRSAGNKFIQEVHQEWRGATLLNGRVEVTDAEEAHLALVRRYELENLEYFLLGKAEWEGYWNALEVISRKDLAVNDDVNIIELLEDLGQRCYVGTGSLLKIVIKESGIRVSFLFACQIIGVVFSVKPNVIYRHFGTIQIGLIDKRR